MASADLDARGDAVIDELTGLFNRKALARRFPDIRAQAAVSDAHLSLLLCDVDRFKTVNDTWGHDRGDQVLRDLATRIREVLRTSDLVFRFGGEEIAILLPGHGLQHAVLTAERLRSSIGTSPLAGLHITLSVGVASARGDAVDLSDLLSRADRALYSAKATGRDRVCSAGAISGTITAGAGARGR
ncbi:GGDEF domain-containing protein [Geodermatophilus sp. FMUSA9-8]|uniref:GGDEF domain-containing protein n=1 Tax=Geodermatophilus sp. FMUSA9-8 TaxID=3120155 RepID=UPI00300A6CCC